MRRLPRPLSGVRRAETGAGGGPGKLALARALLDGGVALTTAPTSTSPTVSSVEVAWRSAPTMFPSTKS